MCWSNYWLCLAGTKFYQLKKFEFWRFVMSKNMASWDRIVRIVLALVFVGLIVTGTVSGWLAIVLGILAAVFVVTSLIGFCPLYAPLHLSTRKES